jgi:DUF971 family protein
MSMTPSAEPPAEITVDGKAGCLVLLWGDGCQKRIPIRRLRDACRCADCERLRRTGSFPAASPEIGIRHVEVYGVAALRLHFSDGHDRGLYPWGYLLELPPDSPAG